MAMHYHIVDIHHKSEHAMHYHSQELIDHLNKVLGCDEKEVPKIKQNRNKKSLQRNYLVHVANIIIEFSVYDCSSL